MAALFPEHIDIDLSAKCNLRCSFCHLSYFTPKDQGDQIDIDAFEATIVPALPHLKSLTLFSKYEVLTCRDFVKIYRRIREYNIEAYFSTNGLLLNDDVLDVIVGHLRFITVSVTGFSRDRYKKFMQTDGLHKVEENLKKLNALKAARGTKLPELRISTVGMQDTLTDIPAAIDFAKKHNAGEGVQLTSLYVFEEGMRSQLPLADMERYNRLTADALAYAQKQGVRLVLQSGSMEDNERETRDISHRYCDIPWHRLSIQPNGDAYPCPVAYKPIGNIKSESIESIWKGAQIETFRAGVNDPANMNPDCVNCIHCRHHSIVDPEKNDFSSSSEFIGGMKRKSAVT